MVCGWVFSDKLLAHFKPKIEQKISDTTGFNVAFRSASLKLYPYLGFTLEGGQATSVSSCSPWKINTASLKIDLIPIFFRRVEIKQIDLEGLEGTLKIDQGRPVLSDNAGNACTENKESLVAAPQIASTPPVGTTAKRSPVMPVDLALEDLKIADVRIQLYVEDKPHDLVLQNLQTALVRDEKGLHLSRLLADGSYDETAGKLELRGLHGLISKGNYSLESAKVQFGDQIITLRGNFDKSVMEGSATLELKEISLGEIGKLVQGSPPQFKGLLNGELVATLAGETLAVAGDASLRDAATSLGGEFALKEIILSDISAKLENFEFKSFSTHLKLAGFNSVYQNDSYQVDRISGPLSLSFGPEIGFGGDLQIANFGYADDETKIEKVVAVLSNISGRVNAKGDVEVGVQLDARSIYLLNPSIEVNSVEQVTAPVTVKVPAKGGYSVSGPVDITNGVLTLADRKLEKTSGKIAMYVSSPLKEFRSSKVSTTSFGQPVWTTAHFTMTRNAYHIDDTLIHLGSGTIGAQFRMSRIHPKPIYVNAQVINLPIIESYKAVMQKPKSPIHGTVASMSVKINGNRDSLMDSLVGTGDILLENAIFKTFDIEQLAKDAISAIPLVGQELVPSESPNTTKEGGISSSIRVENQKASFPNLKVQLSNMTIDSDIQIGFDKSLDGTTSVVFLEETFELLGFGYKRLGDFFAREGRIAIPLLIKGSVTDPKLRPDIEEILKVASGIELVEDVVGGVEEVAESAIEEVEELVDDL